MVQDLSKVPPAVQRARDEVRGVRSRIADALRQCARAVDDAGENPGRLDAALKYWGLAERFAGEAAQFRQAHQRLQQALHKGAGDSTANYTMIGLCVGTGARMCPDAYWIGHEGSRSLVCDVHKTFGRAHHEDGAICEGLDCRAEQREHVQTRGVQCWCGAVHVAAEMARPAPLQPLRRFRGENGPNVLTDSGHEGLAREGDGT